METFYSATESVSMNAGEGPSSYCQNSTFQRGGLQFCKAIIHEAIASHIDVERFSPLHPFAIADLGCSTGPNTFIVVQNLVNALELKYRSCATPPEFQVYFNDQADNDFNKLFRSMPLDKQFLAAGVAGSFYGRLFPKASLHFVHASYALHWLSVVPNELLDKESPAWNKGRITYANAPKEVYNAFSSQFEKDMTSFLDARAEEIVPGGLLALLLIASPEQVPSHESELFTHYDMLGTCLIEMSKLGLLNEAEIDSFNLPVYNTSLKEMKRLTERNRGFSIEIVDALPRHVVADAKATSMILRASTETVFKKPFGSEIMDELYHRLAQKLADSPFLSTPNNPPTELFIILKRKLPVPCL